jgi:hypothetical protein
VADVRGASYTSIVVATGEGVIRAFDPTVAAGCACVYVCVCVGVGVGVWVWVWVWVFTCMHAYIHTYIKIYTSTKP